MANDTDANRAELLMLSARSKDALRTLAVRSGAHLKGAGAQLPLADVSHTLAHGRRRHAVRGAVVAEDVAAAAAALGEERWTYCGISKTEPPLVAFVVQGQGSQRRGMFADLHRDSTVFRRYVAECSDAMADHLGLSLADALFGNGGGTKPELSEAELTSTRFAQPALFLVTAAAARTLQACGVEPAALLGHSLGELTAAYLAGVLGLEDAAGLVVARGKIMQQCEPGAMLAVRWSEDEVAAQLPDRLEIAAVNQPQVTVVGGPLDAVDSWAESLSAKNVPVTKLHTSHAFHTELMDDAVEPFIELVRNCSLKPPEIPVLSNTSGSWLMPEEATDPRYWGRQLRAPVQYLRATQTLLELPRIGLLADLGPGAGLGGPRLGGSRAALAPTGGASTVRSVATGGNRRGYLTVLAAAWACGTEVDARPLTGDRSHRRVSLPGYPFKRRRLWVDGRLGGLTAQSDEVKRTEAESGLTSEPPPTRNPMAEWYWVPCWHALQDDEVNQDESPRSWLIVTADGSLGKSLADSVRHRGGTARTLRVDPATLVLPDSSHSENTPDAVRAIEELLAAQGRFTDIAYVCPAEVANQNRSETARRATFHGMLLLGQTLTRSNVEHIPRVHVVTAGAHAVTTNDHVIPEQAMALGPVQVLPLEHAGLDMRTIDISPDEARTDPAGTVERLHNALCRDGQPVMALRNGQGWIRQFKPADSVTPARSALRRGGSYVVTGGLGGIGLTIARFLVDQYHASVLLLGRRPLGDRGPTLDDLNADGNAVHYQNIDVADRVALQHALTWAEDEFDGIAGVFHCAGVAGAGLADHKVEHDVRAVLGPKVDGTAALRDALDRLKHAPEFVLLFSSHNALLGRFGQVDYCAANSYMDAFAWASAGHPTRWLSVNWDVWADIGMAQETGLPEQLRQWRRETFAYAIRPNEAETAVRHALAVDAPQVIVSTRDFRQVAEEHIEQERDRFRQAVGRFRDSKPATSPRAVSLSAGVALDTQLEAQVARLWCEVLGVQSVGPDEDFLDIGGHSLLATILLGRVGQEFGHRVSLRTFLERPTVAALARVIGSAVEQEKGRSSVAPARVPDAHPAATTTIRTARHTERRVEEARSMTSKFSGNVLSAKASLLFFSADGSQPTGSAYETLLTAARFADSNGFEAVWLPERHFADFGGLYPNPAVVAAALAVVTRHVRLRAGSVISPLHHPARIVEEWAVVDRLSGGRVDLSFGSGWHVNDFIFAPDSYDERKARMFDDIDIVSRLWQGGRASFPNGAGESVAVRTYPAPLQQDLTVWLTGESRDTFVQAGRRGANILTAMMHQQPEELAENICTYREAREREGHDPHAGQVTLMQHTFCASNIDGVWDRVEAAFGQYIAANARLQGQNMRGLGAGDGQINPEDIRVMAERRLADLRDRSGLVGDPERCGDRMDDLSALGVDELAFLIDFLPDDELVVDGLDGLRLALDRHRSDTAYGRPTK